MTGMFIIASLFTLSAAGIAAPGQRGNSGNGIRERARDGSCTRSAADTQPAQTFAPADAGRCGRGCCNRQGCGGRGFGRGAGAGRRGHGRAPSAPATRPAGGGYGAARGMSDAEHEPIHALLSSHTTITRTVREIPSGIESRTTTSDPELVPVLRRHVRQMAARVEQDRPVRLWDPIFADVFAHAERIAIEIDDIDGGVLVKETSSDPDAVQAIRAHAKAVGQFVERGHEAARPPWANQGRGRGRGRG